VPGPTVARLPVYRRALESLVGSETVTVSSAELARLTGVNAATVRRDLSWLGSYGMRGTGYDAGQLLDRVERELALDLDWPVVVIGVGNLGRALARSATFASRGFRVAALIDVDPRIVGTLVGGVVVEHADDLAAVVRRERVLVAVVATPADAAQAVAERLAAAGVQAILNFAPVRLRLKGQVRVRNVDLAAELEVLAFYGSRAGRLRADRTNEEAPAFRGA
jgi:redox-sensing transcriptional repressor